MEQTKNQQVKHTAVTGPKKLLQPFEQGRWISAPSFIDVLQKPNNETVAFTVYSKLLKTVLIHYFWIA